MLKFLYKLFSSRITWICLLLLFEIALMGLFGFVIVASMTTLFNLEPWQIAIIIIAVLYAISFMVIVYIVNSNSNSSYKISWAVLMVVLPLIGCFFYLLFGNKKITNRQKRKMAPISKLLVTNKIDSDIKKELNSSSVDATHMSNYIASSGANVYKNSKVTYYSSGESVFPVMLDELKKAKKFIFIEYFIIANGEFWDSILNILLEKVKEGVDVRLIYDDIGSIARIPHNYDRYLNSLGIKTIVFHRFKPLLDVKLNNRDHRKILIIDGIVGFSGGINLADEYINKLKRFGYWKDNAIKIEGEAVQGLTVLFLSQYFSITSEDISNIKFSDKLFKPYFPDVTIKDASGYVQPYGDIPYINESIGERVYINLIARANKYVYITTPYLIISDELRNALINAVKEGVDVRIITPHIPDKKTTFKITRSYYESLLKNGVKIYEYKPGFIHMKMFVVDDIYGTVGTINLDYRSLYLHFENGVFMYKSSCIKDMKNDFIKTMNESIKITYKNYKEYAAIRRFVWAILRLFAPAL